MAKPLPSAEMLHRLLEYRPVSGSLIHRPRSVDEFPDLRASKIWNTRYAGKEAGTIAVNGYVLVRVKGVSYQAHRLIWKMVYGYDPKTIDHIDGTPNNNRISNLRECDQATNSKNSSIQSNNTSGRTGVSWDKAKQKWLAYIRVDKKHKFLGYFDDFDMAASVRADAEKKYGFHENHGRARSPVAIAHSCHA
jgi:hypothetical protein